MMINVPQFLALQIEAAAEQDRRSMSSWILKLVDEKLASMPEDQQDNLAVRVSELFDALPEKTKTAASVDYMRYMTTKFPELLEGADG